MTIDARLQSSLEQLALERAQRLGPKLSIAMLVIDNATGEVRAQVGSPDYMSRERAGAIDMTRATRSPGSALKPFIYALAFENGLAHPETLLDDRPSRYGGYQPENFDLAFQGTVTARKALQYSLNVPAIELLNELGPSRLLARLQQSDVTIAMPKEAAPGLAVGLGGLGITLTDLTRLYAGLARGGAMPDLVRRADIAPGPPSQRRIADPVAAWYVYDILRGAPPPDNALAGRIAFKTGTSYGYRDAWAVGYDRRFTIGIWVGRPDGTAVPGLVGRLVAAPILFDAYGRLNSEPEALIVAALHLAGNDRHIAAAAPACASRCAKNALGDHPGAPADRLSAGWLARRIGTAGCAGGCEPCVEGVRRGATIDVDGGWRTGPDRKPSPGSNLEPGRSRFRPALCRRFSGRDGQRRRPGGIAPATSALDGKAWEQLIRERVWMPQTYWIWTGEAPHPYMRACSRPHRYPRVPARTSSTHPWRSNCRAF